MTRRPREVPQPGTEGESGCSCDQASQRPALIELAQDFDVHPNQVKQWRDPLLEGATGVFGEAPKAEPEPIIDVKTLHATIGDLTLENDLLSGALGTRRACCRAQEDDRSGREAERQPPGHRAGDQPGQRLLQAPPGVGRGSEADATLIDKLHLEFPFAGSRMLQGLRVRGKASRLGGCMLPR